MKGDLLSCPHKKKFGRKCYPRLAAATSWLDNACSVLQGDPPLELALSLTPYYSFLVPRAQTNHQNFLDSVFFQPGQPHTLKTHPKKLNASVMGMRSQTVEKGVLPSVLRWISFCIVKVRIFAMKGGKWVNTFIHSGLALPLSSLQLCGVVAITMSGCLPKPLTLILSPPSILLYISFPQLVPGK